MYTHNIWITVRNIYDEEVLANLTKFSCSRLNVDLQSMYHSQYLPLMHLSTFRCVTEERKSVNDTALESVGHYQSQNFNSKYLHLQVLPPT
jgi:hypothetical protein